MSIYNIHIGHRNAFNGWKLIWTDSKGNTFLKSIPKKTAKALIKSGITVEG